MAEELSGTCAESQQHRVHPPSADCDPGPQPHSLVLSFTL